VTPEERARLLEEQNRLLKRYVALLEERLGQSPSLPFRQKPRWPSLREVLSWRGY